LHKNIRRYIKELALKIKWECKKNLPDDFALQTPLEAPLGQNEMRPEGKKERRRSRTKELQKRKCEYAQEKGHWCRCSTKRENAQFAPATWSK